MAKKSLIRKYFLSSMLFGIMMGCIFPLYSLIFVEFKSTALMWGFIAGCIVAGILVGLFSFIIAKVTVLNSVKAISKSLQEVADNSDLTTRLSIVSADEIGLLSDNANHLLDSICEIIDKLKKQTAVIQRLLELLATSSENLDSVAITMVDQSHEFDSATKTLKESLEKVTTMSDDSSQDMGNIAAAVTSMSTTIDQISRKTLEASQIASLAVENSEENLSNIKKLEAIGQSTEAILESVDSITKQTELIAVNANIEAVRAGTAGKAFSVVAGEVKTLAEETKKAVTEIRNLIHTMSDATGKTTTNIESIDGVLTDMKKIISVIKEEITKQNVDAEMISKSVDDSLIRVVSSARRAHESSEAVSSMSNSMANIHNSVQNARNAELALNSVLHDLEHVSHDVNQSISKFKTE